MAIAKRPHSKQSDIAAKEAFISAKPEPVKRKKLIATVIRFDPDLLERIDAIARRRGLSRAAIVQFLVGRGIDAGEG
jgi:hypothetical protein